MRVVFLDVSAEKRTEYDVHRLLARNANQAAEYIFFNQEPYQAGMSLEQSQADHTYYYDFGRNMSISPKPSRMRRAGMMAWHAPGAFRYLFSAIKKIQPDLIYTSQQQLDMAWGSFFSARFRIPHVVHLHYPVGPWLGKNTIKQIQKVSRCIAVSNFVAQGAVNAGIHPEKIDVVPNPVEASRFDRTVPERGYWQEYGWGSDCLVITSAGRLDPSKGHSLLLDAFAMVARACPQVRLLICGSSTYRDNYGLFLKEKVKKLGLGDMVAFAGYRNDMPQVFANSQIFCLPTQDEAFGLIFVEAMAAGIPVVAINSGAVPEIILHGETGLISEPGDASGLARNLCSLIQNNLLARKLSTGGRERARAIYAPRKISALWSEILLRQAALGLQLK